MCWDIAVLLKVAYLCLKTKEGKIVWLKEGSFSFFALVTHVVLSLVYQEHNIFQTHAGINSTHDFPLMNTQYGAVCCLSRMSLHNFFFFFSYSNAKTKSQGRHVDSWHSEADNGFKNQGICCFHSYSVFYSPSLSLTVMIFWWLIIT